MQCMSCESEINPKWKHAINENICPFCGENIMVAQLKELLCLIGNKIEHVRDLGFSNQFDDWLLSNYGFVRIDSPNLIQYVDPALLQQTSEQPKVKCTMKVKTDKGEEDVVTEQIKSDEATSAFFKRAEAVKPGIDGFNSAAEKTEHLKKMAQQIRKAGSAALTETDGGFITAEMLEGADPEAIAEWQGLLSSEGEVSSAIAGGGDDDEIPAVVMAMANQTNPSGSSKNARDLLKLQQMQDRVNKSRHNFKNGGGGGSFSRS